jgi:hypothetical protein
MYGTDCIGSCKSNYHTTMPAPSTVEHMGFELKKYYIIVSVDGPSRLLIVLQLDFCLHFYDLLV